MKRDRMSLSRTEPPARRPARPQDEMALAALVSRVLDRGVVVSGEVVIGVAGVDLLYLGLDLVLTSVETLERSRSHGASAAPGTTHS